VSTFYDLDTPKGQAWTAKSGRKQRPLAGPLTGTTVTPNVETSQCPMLRLPACNALAPHGKRTFLHLTAHKVNNFRLVEPVLGFNNFKGRSILPSHLNNTANVIVRKSTPKITQFITQHIGCPFTMLYGAWRLQVLIVDSFYTMGV
jgi:hypothetical protein